VTYRSRSEFDKARDLLTQAVALNRDHGAPADRLATALSELAWVETYVENYDLAKQYLTQGLAQISSLGSAYAEQRGLMLQRLAIVEMNRQDLVAADERLAEALSEFEVQQPVSQQHLSSTLSLRGSVAYGRNDLDTALAAYEAALPAKKEIFGEAHHSVALSISNIATVRFQRGEHAEAAARYREAISINEAFFGTGEHVQLGNNWRGLAKALQGLGAFEQSIEAFLRALDIWKATLGESHSETLRVRAELAEFLWLLGRFDDAVAAQASAPVELLESRDQELACLARVLTAVRAWHLDAALSSADPDCISILPVEKQWRARALLAIATPSMRQRWSIPFSVDAVGRSPLFNAAIETLESLSVD
ncbi:MAG: tetratricopeptide repeat protein, partial [Pseudomonadota bacterium]